MKKLLLLLFVLGSLTVARAQQRAVAGRVTDQSSNESLPGVTVTVKGSTRGTVTDATGNYSTSATDNDTLVFSSIGYATTEQLVGKQSTLNIALRAGTNNLDEVVVVGYGTQKRANLTGAVSQIKREELLVRQVATASNLLQGLAPGVIVTQQSGRPGADGANITIRGVGSISAGTTPLLVIDGVQQPPNTLETLNNIDPNNIESITVLKDAASTAIYGARASNGVIVVKTRRGSGEGIQVSYNGFVSQQWATALPERVSAIEHMELRNLAVRNTSGASAQPEFSPALIDAYRSNPSDNFRYIDTDWQRGVLTNSGLMQNHNINLSGGSERFKFFAAGTFLDQQGLTQTTSFKRYDLRFNSDIKINEKLSFQGDLVYTNGTEIQPGGSSAEFIIRRMIGYPAIGAGKFGPGQYGDGGQSNFANPIGQAEASGSNRFQRPNIIFRGSLTYRPFKFMDVEVMFSNNTRNQNQKRFLKNYPVFRPDLTNNVLAFVANVPGQNSIADAVQRHRLNNYLIQSNFYHSVGRHDLRLLLGFQAEDFYSETLAASRTDLPLDLPFQVVGTANQATNSNVGEYALAAFFGRFNYNYDNKYLLEINGRYDGSSRFSPIQGQQWGFFPSASVGWVISRENFMGGLNNTVTFAKLRASYGKLGNQNLVNPDGSQAFYPSLATLPFGANFFFNNRLNVGVAQTNDANANITWETSTQANVGIDLTLWKRLNITADVFDRRIDNLLLIRPIPNYTGLSPAFINTGAMQNRGWELSVGYNGSVGGLRYGVTGIVSDVQNKVLDLGGQDLIEGRFISRPGQPLRSYFGWVSDGLYQSASEIAPTQAEGTPSRPFLATNTAPGDVKYRDLSGPTGQPDGRIDGFDRTLVGNNFPRYTYSLNANLSWKGFDLNVFFQGVGRRDSYISGTGAWAFFASDFIATAYGQHRDNWRPNNPGASYPRLTTDQGTFNWRDSNYWVRNAAYLRLKNVQLGYTIPNALTQRLKINSVRFYVSGQNLLTFTKFIRGFDPERDDQDGQFYPVMRTVTAGLNLRF